MKYRTPAFVALFLGLAAFSAPAGAFHFAPHASSAGGQQTTASAPGSSFQYTPQISSVGGQQTASIGLPSDSINLSQLQDIFSQFPGISQFNLQFPNQTNWNITPDKIQALYNNYLQEAQSMGFTGKLPDLSFSSLSSLDMNSIKSGIATFSVDGMKGMMGNIKTQMDQELRQFRYQELHLGGWMPEWMKRFILSVYDAFLRAVDFMYAKLSALI